MVKSIGILIASGASEGVEETLESLLSPFLQKLSYDKNAKTILQDPSLLADAAYDGLIGAILGLFGRGTNSAIDLVDNMVHNNIMPGEKLMADAGVGEPEVLGAMAIYEMGNAEDALGTHAIDLIVDLKPNVLMEELKNNGEKFNIDDVVAITRNSDNKLLWLEQGNHKAGLIHIIEGHEGDFSSKGVENIPQFLVEVLKTNPVKKGRNSKGPYADYELNGDAYRIAYGDNGFIVSFYPID